MRSDTAAGGAHRAAKRAARELRRPNAGRTLPLAGLLMLTAACMVASAQEPIRRFEGHTLPVHSAAFSPDGKHLLTGSFDGTARLWNAATGETLRIFAPESGWIGSVAFSPDGAGILTAGEDGNAKLWETVTGNLLRTFEGHGDAVSGAVFSPDGQRILTGSADATAKLWDTGSGTEIRTFEGHTGAVHAVAFSPDGARIATGSSDQTARLWNADTGETLQSFSGHTRSVRSVAFSPNGQAVLTGSRDGTVRLWRAESGEGLQRLHDPDVHFAAFAGEDAKVVTGNQAGTVRLWDIRTRAILRTVAEHGAPALSIALSPDRMRLLSGGGDGEAKLWKTYSADLAMRVSGDLEFGRVVAGERPERTFSVENDLDTPFAVDSIEVPDGFSVETNSTPIEPGRSREFVVTFFPSEARVYEGEIHVRSDATAGSKSIPVAGQGVLFEPSLILSADGDPIRSAALSNDGDRFLAGGATGTVRLWDLASGDLLKTFEGAGDSVSSVALSPDGNIAAAAIDRSVQLWNTNSGDARGTFEDHERSVVSVVFSPDGTRVLSVDRLHALALLWDVDTLEVVQRFEGGSNWFRDAAISPGGTAVLIGTDNGTARLWDAETGEIIRDFTGHDGSVTAVAFSPDGARILTGSTDRTARIWSADTGSPIRTLEGHPGWVFSAAFSPDGNRVLTGGLGGASRIWDANTGELLRTFDESGEGNSFAGFHPDGQRVLTAGAGDTIRLWDIVINPSTTYAAWAAAIGESTDRNPADSPFGDRVPNVLKYALGIEPERRVSEPLIRTGIHTGEPFTAEFDRGARREDVSLYLETSTDLHSWTPVAHADGAAPFVDLETETVTVTRDLHTRTVTLSHPPAAGEDRRLFVRLRAVLDDTER